MIPTAACPRPAARGTRLGALLFAGLGVSQGPTFAQLSSAAVDEPSTTVVVTSTRAPTRVDEQVAEITVLDRAQIERGGGSTPP
jgi:outer membrane cobalamin receptor